MCLRKKINKREFDYFFNRFLIRKITIILDVNRIGIVNRNSVFVGVGVVIGVSGSFGFRGNISTEYP